MTLYTITITPIGVNTRPEIYHVTGGTLTMYWVMAKLGTAIFRVYGGVDAERDEFNSDKIRISSAGVHILDIEIEDTPDDSQAQMCGA